MREEKSSGKYEFSVIITYGTTFTVKDGDTI